MYPVPVEKVSETMGGAGVLGSAPATVGELAQAVARGLPRAVVRQIAVRAAASNGAARQFVSDLVASSATLKRSERLSPAASERAERLARVVALARQSLGDPDEASVWLNEAHPLLGNRPPIQIAATELAGARKSRSRTRGRRLGDRGANGLVTGSFRAGAARAQLRGQSATFRSVPNRGRDRGIAGMGCPPVRRAGTG